MDKYKHSVLSQPSYLSDMNQWKPTIHSLSINSQPKPIPKWNMTVACWHQSIRHVISLSCPLSDALQLSIIRDPLPAFTASRNRNKDHPHYRSLHACIQHHRWWRRLLRLDGKHRYHLPDTTDDHWQPAAGRATPQAKHKTQLQRVMGRVRWRPNSRVLARGFD